jgi:hypothetical protein
MTNAPDVVATDGVPTALACPACGHALDAHDRVGSRWCLATSARGGSRDCVCPDAARVVLDLTYHGGLTPNRR